MTKSISAALLAASIVFGVSAVSLAQTAPSAAGAGPTGAKAPSDTTGSGKDTGMQVPSGMSGNGPGGVGTAASPTATNPATSSSAGTSSAGTSSAGAASSSTGKSGASKSKKTAQHSKKHTASSTSR